MKAFAPSLLGLLAGTSALRNVLLITVDDLRPQLNASYGMTETSTPNIDRLALDLGSTTFLRAYCQMAVCSPSRNSFMTGRRPETTRVLNFWDDFRIAGANWTTMPQYFKESGFSTYGFGKLYHPDNPRQNNTAHNDFPRSWTQDEFNSFYWGNSEPIGDAGGCSSRASVMNTSVPPSLAQYASAAACQGADDVAALNDNDNRTASQASQGVEYDHRVATRALEAMAHARARGKPFFVSAGFRRPHLQWRTPKRFWEQYADVADTLSLAKVQTIGTNVTELAFDTNGEMAQVYKRKAPNGTIQNFQISPHGPPLPAGLQRALRRGYYASVSFLDFEVGRLLDGLEKLGLAERTAVIFHADHGWKLGEHGDWSKCTNWEMDARVPLIIRAPWLQRAGSGHAATGATRSKALAELVDLFPTAVELAGLPAVPVAEGLEGTSLVPALRAPADESAGAAHAFSQYPRCPEYDLQTQGVMWECLNVQKQNITLMGYSVRSPQWRYTEWRRWLGTATPMQGDWAADGLVAQELYSHAANTGLGRESMDDFEYVNEAYDESRAPVIAELATVLRAQFERG